ncbi:LURP-one-related/scramblase family protein [Clostridium celatum]|uniref:Tubby C 2 n=1 Tax=Clostridium celatum DSM 1785 TaxID=545697 RepID=L1Q919_9CLOT|nr:hypothetical protein [Clostridium celatum]EKY24464.1 hypothetical protein HMPREF0216_02687 [Clostridium celatum DSM 1785]MCE9656459.1 hypothetical protein [Clostridium celatum]
MYIHRLDGSEFSVIKKKTGFISDKYTIYCGGENLASIKRHMTSIKPKISIVTNKHNYLVSGDIMANDFTICNNGITVAKITKTTFNIKDKYRIDIFDEDNADLFLSAVIAIDNSIHN